MNRRRFLREGIACGGLALGTGGFLFIRRNHARGEATARMLEDALPALAQNSLKELQTLPVRAREEVRRYFHGKCLNVAGFITHICSPAFGELLGYCRTQEERESCFLQAFCARVTTEAEILNRVYTFAAEAGSVLDSAWADYCSSLSIKWNTHIQKYGNSLTRDEFVTRLDGMIHSEIDQVVRQAVPGLQQLQQPTISGTLHKIGESAIRLLPQAKVRVALGPGWIAAEGNFLVLPVFFIEAAKHTWDYMMPRLQERRGDYQGAISGRLALLGNRVGAEFEQEIRRRLADLHTWREGAIRQTAERLAEERIGLL